MGETSAEAVMAELLRDPQRQKTITIKELKRRKRQKRRLTKQRKEGFKIDSSWVHELRYFMEERKVWTLFNGKKYTYFNIPQAVFTSWWEGAATCITDDTEKSKRWFVGKTPSLGAFFNSNILNSRTGKSRYRWIRGWV